jgi:hypothetical protein
MSNVIIISKGKYTVTGFVGDNLNNKGILGLHVIAYCKMPKIEPKPKPAPGIKPDPEKRKYSIPKHKEADYFLGIGVTDKTGKFEFSFEYKTPLFCPNKKPDLFLVIKDGGQELPIMEKKKDKWSVIANNVLEIKAVTETTPPINALVYLADSTLRALINENPDEGWDGGFLEDHPALAYPKPYHISLGKENNKKYEYIDLKRKDVDTPPNDFILKNGKVLKKIYPASDLSSLGNLKDNLMNIDLLDRQQKVVWAEFTWKSKPCRVDDNKKKYIIPKDQVKVKVAQNRCYKMFSPDISRLGYDKKGRVYSIICPQQGTYIPLIGTMNLEITVNGNRGWVDESVTEKNIKAKEKEGGVAADMGVEAKIWFSHKAKKSNLLRGLITSIERDILGGEYDSFPSSKEKAIRIRTFRPGFPDQSTFSLKKGLCKEFEIPEFAKHEDISWSVAHLGVQIGSIIKTGCPKIDKFNQTILGLFNVSAGNMLTENNVLTWNVWFTAPEIVDKQEWRDHADKWRESIDADHDTPGGPGTIARYFDGTPLETSRLVLAKKLLSIVIYVIMHYFIKAKYFIRRLGLRLLKYVLRVLTLKFMLIFIGFLIMFSFLMYLIFR